MGCSMLPVGTSGVAELVMSDMGVTKLCPTRTMHIASESSVVVLGAGPAHTVPCVPAEKASRGTPSF